MAAVVAGTRLVFEGFGAGVGAGVYKFQGSVDTYDDLEEISDAWTDEEKAKNNGFVYNVADTGQNFAWNGEAWDNIGGEFSEGAGITITSSSESNEIAITGANSATNGQFAISDGNSSLTWRRPEVSDVSDLTATATELNYVHGVTSNIQTQINSKQETLINQTNIKSINGNSLLGSGDLELTQYLGFPSNWPTTNTTTTKQFCDIVAADVDAIEGKMYLGEVRWSDLPASMVNAEVTVSIMKGKEGEPSSNKVIVLNMTSGNRAPYQWQYTYWNGGLNTSDWIGFQPELKSGTGITISQNNTISANLMTGADGTTAGTSGIVPAPTATDNVKFLRGDGTWSEVDAGALPDQTGNAGKLLTTDGTDASWMTKDYYKSLSTTQEATLLNDGTYNGEEVTSGAIFTTEEGSFKEFNDDVTYGGDAQLDFSAPYGPEYTATYDLGNNNYGSMVYCRQYGDHAVLTIKDNALLYTNTWMGVSLIGSDGTKIYGMDLFNGRYWESTDGISFGNQTDFYPLIYSGVVSYSYYHVLGKHLLVRAYTNGGSLRYSYADTMSGTWTESSLPTGVTQGLIFVFSDEVRLVDILTNKIYSKTDLTQDWTDTGDVSSFPSGGAYHYDSWSWAIGENAMVYFDTSISSHNVYYSTDRGKTWSTSNLPVQNYYRIVYVASTDTFVAISRSDLSKYYLSTDGGSWLAKTPESGTTIYDTLCGGYDCAYTISTSGCSRIFTGTQHDRSLTKLEGCLPSQSGNSGKVLSTDGTNASWATISQVIRYSADNPSLTSSNDICTWTVTHNLNSKNLIVAVYDTTTGEELLCDKARINNNTLEVSIVSTLNIPADTYKVVILA